MDGKWVGNAVVVVSACVCVVCVLGRGGRGGEDLQSVTPSEMA